MFGQPVITLATVHERHQTLITEADHRRLLTVARRVRKERKERKIVGSKLLTVGVSVTP